MLWVSVKERASPQQMGLKEGVTGELVGVECGVAGVCGQGLRSVSEELERSPNQKWLFKICVSEVIIQGTESEL